MKSIYLQIAVTFIVKVRNIYSRIKFVRTIKFPLSSIFIVLMFLAYLYSTIRVIREQPSYFKYAICMRLLFKNFAVKIDDIKSNIWHRHGWQAWLTRRHRLLPDVQCSRKDWGLEMNQLSRGIFIFKNWNVPNFHGI